MADPRYDNRPMHYRRAGGTDWPRLLLDLRGAGVSLRRTAMLIRRPLSTVKSWATGCEPRHADGERLLTLWDEHVAQRMTRSNDVVGISACESGSNRVQSRGLDTV